MKSSSISFCFTNFNFCTITCLFSTLDSNTQYSYIYLLLALVIFQFKMYYHIEPQNFCWEVHCPKDKWKILGGMITKAAWFTVFHQLRLDVNSIYICPSFIQNHMPRRIQVYQPTWIWKSQCVCFLSRWARRTNEHILLINICIYRFPKFRAVHYSKGCTQSDDSTGLDTLKNVYFPSTSHLPFKVSPGDTHQHTPDPFFCISWTIGHLKFEFIINFIHCQF